MLGNAVSAYLSTHGGNVLIRRVSESGEQEWLAAAWYAMQRQIRWRCLSWRGPWAIHEKRGDCLTAEKCGTTD